MPEAAVPAAAGAPPWSLQQRLRRQLLAVLAGCWLAGSAVTLVGLWHESSEVLDSALAETAQRLLALPEPALGEAGAPLAAGVGPHEEFVVYQLFDEAGQLRLRSHAAPAQPLDAGAPDGIRAAGGWHVLTLTRDDGRRRAQVAETVAHRHEVLWNSVAWLAGTLLALLPLAALATSAVLARAFATLEPVRRELSARDPGDLQPVDTDAAPLELRPLLDTINTLFGRVHALLSSERAFAANAAHELRTPLAAARAQAQRLLAAEHGATRPQAEALLRQLDRLGALSTRLLQLARVEAGVALRREPVDLVLLAGLVADEFPEALRSGRLQLQIDDAAGSVTGDLDAIGIALRNLIDNALRHGGAQVLLHVGAGLLEVSDDGDGVDPGRLPLLRQRFERAPGAAHGGSGIGLALVDTIARQSGATLELASRMSQGRGFHATLRFAPTVRAAP